MKKLVYLGLLGVVIYGFYMYGDKEQFAVIREMISIERPVEEVVDLGVETVALLDSYSALMRDYDEHMFLEVFAEDAVIEYDGHNWDRDRFLEYYRMYHGAAQETGAELQDVIVDGERFAFVLAFDQIEKESGVRKSGKNAILGQVKDNKIIVWKEYVDSSKTAD